MCNSPISSKSCNTYTFDNKKAFFCKACWEQSLNLRGLGDGTKEEALSYFEEKEANNLTSQTGKDFIEKCQYIEKHPSHMQEDTPSDPTGQTIQSHSENQLHSEAGTNSSKYSTAFSIIGIIFLVAAFICYNQSVQNVKGQNIANVQLTVFAAANFLAGIINFAAAGIIRALKQ